VFAKLAVVILTIGAVAATLLAARQQRLYAVHESAESMRRISEHDRTLWRLRGEIAERVTPGKVRRLATEKFGPLAYLGRDRVSPLERNEDGSGVRTAGLEGERAPDDEVTETSDWGDATATAPEGEEQE
jgi:hypothetical protein